MDRAQVHFELFARRKPSSAWTLELATEDRAAAVEAAEVLFIDQHYAAVRVNKETLDPGSREFQTVTVMSRGALERGRREAPQADLEPLCVTPQDLYSGHARGRIGRLLEDWLARRRATPFELLHRADLVEALEASGKHVQHAIQKVAVPEAQARGVTTHSMVRSFQKLADRAIERILKDAKRGAFPRFDRESFAAAASRVAGGPEAAYLLGGGVAEALAHADHWAAKVARLMDLADSAPEQGPPRGLALAVIEQPLAEILASRVGLGDLLGADLDLGASLAAMARLAAGEAVAGLIAIEPSVARVMPAMPSTAARLSRWLDSEDFESVRIALGRRVLAELNGPRRLRPHDPAGEIEMLRALGMVLTASAGRLMPLEDVQAAFIQRSQMLVTGDFVEAYLGHERSAREEVDAILWLTENVIGPANKRRAARWLEAAVTALRFERELRGGPDSPAVKLSALAALQKAVARAGLAEADVTSVQAALGGVGGLVEADLGLIAAIGKAPAPPIHRVTLLLRMALGEAAPLGPAAERARAEAVRMLRAPETRAELARVPKAALRVRNLIQAAGLAA